jgi:phytoene desaturase
VTEITTDEARRVTGVRLADGTALRGRAVVANVDVTTVYHDLLDRRVAALPLRRLARREPSLSGFVLLLGLEGISEELAQHNILFPPNYRREFKDIFRRGKPPQSPTIYISISSRRDADHAPAGCENWFVLINVPPLSAHEASTNGRGFDWQREAPHYRNLVLNRIEAMGIKVRDRLRSEHCLTPLDLAQRTGAWRGALYGLSSNHALTALRRPPPRDRRFHGLYFAGGTTHPGGGVPMVTLSGGVAARLLQADLVAERLKA